MFVFLATFWVMTEL